MEFNKKMLTIYTKELGAVGKEGLARIILVTDNRELQQALVSDVCTLYYENTEEHTEALRSLLLEFEDKLKKVVFCPIMNKDNNLSFIEHFNTTFLDITIDIDAWQIRRNKSNDYYILNVNELVANVQDFAIKRGYFVTSKEELEEKEANLNNFLLLVDNEGTKKSLKELGFNCELLNLDQLNRYKSKNIILINNNDKEIATSLINYCFTLKVINISIMDKESFVNQITKAKAILPSWVKQSDPSKEIYKLNQDLLAVQYINNTNLIQVLNMDKQDSYIYDKGVYKLVTKEFIKKEIGEYIPTGKANNSFVSDCVNMVHIRARLVKFEELNADENIINFKNGIYNIEKDILEPHNPSVLSTIQINCNYKMYEVENIEYIGLKFKKYIYDLCTDALTGELDQEKMQHLQMWGGLTISNIPMFKTKACLCLFSKNGDTGKSVFLNLLNILLGQENTSNIQIQDLAKPFSTSAIYGKRANIVGDQKATVLQDSSIFKQFTGGDPLNVEFKGKTSFSYLHKGGLLFACNSLPYISDDKGTHIYDRLHIVPFNNVIPLEQRNPNLLSELISEELDHIAMWLMVGLYDFIEAGCKIPKCKASIEVVERFRENNDHLYSFLINNYEITGNAQDRVVKTELEEHYLKWCEEEEIPEKAIISKRGFKNVMQDSYNIGIIRDSKGFRYYKGLKIKIIDSIEQGEQVEKEVKQIFAQQKL